MASPERCPTVRASNLRLAAGAALAALALVVGCGSEESPNATGAAAEQSSDVVDISESGPVGEVLAGSAAYLVECRDWNDADEGQRLATIEDVRSQQHPEDPGIEEPALTDEEAAQFFDTACEPEYAQGFRLYKLYARAAGFLPLTRELEK